LTAPAVAGASDAAVGLSFVIIIYYLGNWKRNLKLNHHDETVNDAFVYF